MRRLRCKNPDCQFRISPKNGIDHVKTRTVFYGALRAHEENCPWDLICREADNEGDPERTTKNTELDAGADC
jgi:hypothetical protein